MKQSIRILSYTTVLILFFSCMAKKTLVQSSTDQRTTQQNAVSTTQKSQSDAVISVQGKSSDSVQTVTQTVKYDTSKPVSEVTGKAPISEETTITEIKIGNKIVSKKIETANSAQSDSTDNSKIETATKEESKAVEIPKPPAVKYYFYILITLILLAAGYFVYRNFARIKTILSAILP
ncbi:MAG: hypothetical protein WCI31_15990 [Prolixibacteraceae bacterium]